MYTLRSGVLDVVRLGGYTRCAGAGSLIERGGYVTGDDLLNCQKPRKNDSLIERGEQESLEHRWCKLLHKDRSTAGCGNTLFSYPAMDLHDKRENMLIPKPHNTPFSCLTISIFCGAERFRTRRFAPPLNTKAPHNEGLLHYTDLVRPDGFEPPTCWV